MKRIRGMFMDGWNDDWPDIWLVPWMDLRAVSAEDWSRYIAARDAYQLACLDLKRSARWLPLTDDETERGRIANEQAESEYTEITIREQASCPHTDDYGTLFDPDSARCMLCGAGDPLRVELLLPIGQSENP